MTGAQLVGVEVHADWIRLEGRPVEELVEILDLLDVVDLDLDWLPSRSE